MISKKARPVFPCALLLAIVAGCSSTPERQADTPVFDAVVIRNHALYDVREVELQIPGSDAAISCGTIGPRASCTNDIPETAYQDVPLTLNWQYADGGERTMPLTLRKPRDFDAGDNHVAVIEFQSGGILSVYWQAH